MAPHGEIPSDQAGVSRWLVALVVLVVLGGGAGVAVALTGGSGPDETASASSEPSAATSSSPDAARSPGAPSGDASRSDAPSSDASSSEGPGPDTPTATSRAERKSLFADALSGKAAVRCTYSQKGVTGTVYLQGRHRLRVDFTNPGGQKGHILKKRTAGYVWGSGMAKGIKFGGGAGSRQLDQVLSQFTPEKLAQKVKAQQVACSKYAGDKAVFVVPSDVQFVSLPGKK